VSFEFAHPWLLWLLLALPVLAWLLGRSGRRAALRFSDTRLAAGAGRSTRVRPGAMLLGLRLLTLGGLILALAGPRMRERHENVQASGVDILLAVDVSNSMAALDFTEDIQKPVTRLDIVKEVVADFVQKRPNDRIGIVAFAKNPWQVSPLTLDHDWLLKNLERLRLGLIDGERTVRTGCASWTRNRVS